MWRIIKKNKIFFITYFIFLVAGFTLQLYFSQANLFLLFNANFYALGDYFLPYWTSVGDGLFSAVVILFLLLFRNYKDAISFAIVFIVSSAIAQIIKIYIFPNRDRPQPFFLKLHENIHIIKGLEIHQFNSFPSGHSTSAFAMFCFLGLIWTKKQWGWLLFILAFSVAYSRMYLAQHFFIDIYAGSIIGVLCAIIFYWAFENVQVKEWHGRAALKRKTRIPEESKKYYNE